MSAKKILLWLAFTVWAGATAGILTRDPSDTHAHDTETCHAIATTTQEVQSKARAIIACWESAESSKTDAAEVLRHYKREHATQWQMEFKRSYEQDLWGITDTRLLGAEIEKLKSDLTEINSAWSHSDDFYLNIIISTMAIKLAIMATENQVPAPIGKAKEVPPEDTRG